MGIDENAQHAKRFVVFNKAHAAHIGCQVENHVRSADCSFARRFVPQIQYKILDIFGSLLPTLERFQVDSANRTRALGKKTLRQVSSDKSAASADHGFLVLQFQN